MWLTRSTVEVHYNDIHNKNNHSWVWHVGVVCPSRLGLFRPAHKGKSNETILRHNQ